MKYVIDVPETYVTEGMIFGKKLVIPVHCLGGESKISTGIKLTPIEEEFEETENNVWEFVNEICDLEEDTMVDVFGFADVIFVPDAMSYKEAKAKFEHWKEHRYEDPAYKYENPSYEMGEVWEMYDGKKCTIIGADGDSVCALTEDMCMGYYSKEKHLKRYIRSSFLAPLNEMTGGKM